MEITVSLYRHTLTMSPRLVLWFAQKNRVPALPHLAPRTRQMLWNKALRAVGIAA